MNDDLRLSESDVEEMLEETGKRLDEIESLFPVKGEVLYYLSGLLPLALFVVSTAIFAVAESTEQKASAGNLMLMALLSVVIYKIDRVFEYIMMRFDLYDLELIKEGDANEPTED